LIFCSEIPASLNFSLLGFRLLQCPLPPQRPCPSDIAFPFQMLEQNICVHPCSASRHFVHAFPRICHRSRMQVRARTTRAAPSDAIASASLLLLPS
jgi:hypothetical protein